MKIKRPRTTARGTLLAAIVTGIIVVATLSGVLSYRTLIDWAESEYKEFAPLFAAIIDVGMVVFALATLWKILAQQRKLGVRLATHTLAGLSILFNALSGTTTESILIHATPPLILVMAVETLLGIVWKRQQEISPQLDRIRVSRWLLAPISTASIWRRMVLWELRSYAAAMEIDRERIKSRIKLKQQAGTRYWFRVPADRRIDLKLKLLELAKNHTGPVPIDGSGPVPGTPATVPAATVPVPAGPAPQRSTVPGPVPVNGSRPAASRPAVKPAETGTAVADEQIMEVLEQLYNSDPRDPDRPFKTVGDVAKHFGVRKARVSKVNQARRAAAEAAPTPTTSS